MASVAVCRLFYYEQKEERSMHAFTNMLVKMMSKTGRIGVRLLTAVAYHIISKAYDIATRRPETKKRNKSRRKL